MEGSLYPDGVTVDHVALRRTERTKSAEILRNRLDWTSRGILTGGVVTVNGSGVAPFTHIDITQATGFVPNGEFIDIGSAFVDISLADETSGVVNYVCAVYTETNKYYQPHESNGNTYPIYVEGSSRVRIYTEAQYGALPLTDDNLANDAQDRILLIAKVTANGPASSLTASSIQSPTEYNNILYSTPRALLTILGVDVVSFTPDTPVGDGTLSYTYVGAGNYDFTWTTSNGVGAATNVTSDGTYDVLDGAGESIRILVATTVLPTTGTFPLTEVITVTNLYAQDIPRLTADDHLHRNMQGTGTISPENPHGQSLDDFSGESFSLLNEHQDVMHSNGIWRGSQPTCLAVTINEAAAPDTFSVQAPVGNDKYYVNGVKMDEVNSPTGIQIIPTPAQSTYMYEVYVSDEKNVSYVAKATYPVTRNMTGTWILDMSPDYPAGSAVLAVTATGPGPWTFTWDGGEGVIVYAAEPPHVVRLYAADGVHWVDVWVNTATGGAPTDDKLPTASTSDTIAVAASMTTGSDEYMRIACLPYWYNSASAAWILGYDPVSTPRQSVDARIWGNLGKAEMADGALQDLIYSPTNELGRSGVLLRRNGAHNEFNSVYIGTGFAFTINGGSYYCRGQRITASTVQSLAVGASALQLVWADMSGAYNVIDVTGTYGGDIQAAMRYVLGGTQDVSDVSDVYHYSDTTDPPERGVLLYYVETNATDITTLREFTQNVNHVDDPWSVGSRYASGSVKVGQCAYDNLFTAFEYARYATYRTMDHGPVEITVRGVTTVDSPITQPTGVHVKGFKDKKVPPTAMVQISSLGGVTEIWTLSEGNKVSDLYVVNYNTAGAGAVFAPHNYVTIDGCTSVSSGGNFMGGSQAAITSCTGVRVTNNYVQGGGFFNLFSVAINGSIDWVISGNRMYVTAASGRYGFILTNMQGLTFTSNHV
ncbi:MAG: hypothetical protein DRP01_07550, partial [Archaeoglobales archaeon]